MLSMLKNEFPPAETESHNQRSRYLLVIRMGWVALLPSFIFGYMEAMLNSSFPLYALHMGLQAKWVSFVLAAFVVGSLILQLPLGRLSDAWGRPQVMRICAVVGAISFLLFPSTHSSFIAMIVTLGVAGACVGSFYSLGFAYATDILPVSMIPTAGAIASMNYSVACILSPNINGWIIQHVNANAIFWGMGGLLLVFIVSSLFSTPSSSSNASNSNASTTYF